MFGAVQWWRMEKPTTSIASASDQQAQNPERVQSADTVCFLLPAIGQPRWSKRIAMLKAEGLSVSAFAFERDYHRGRLPDCEVHMLGAIAKGQYLRRLWALAKAVPLLRKGSRQADAIYAFGLDLVLLAMLANLFRRKPIFFEVGDIRPIQVASGVKGRLMKFLSQKTYDYSSLLVVTAEDFVTGYYADTKPSGTPWLVIENKLDLPEASRANTSLSHENNAAGVHAPAGGDGTDSGKPPTGEPVRKRIVIGYFGLLRSPWSFSTLAQYARENPDTIRIVLAGARDNEYESFAQLVELDNVEYLGPYRSPDDLPRLYQQVDLVWGCYPEPATRSQSENAMWSWAQAVCRSNRFYECCFYRIPIISMANSSDGKVVASENLGPVIHSHEYAAIKQQLDAISSADLGTWQRNLNKLPASVYCYTTESAELAQIVRQQIRAS